MRSRLRLPTPLAFAWRGAALLALSALVHAELRLPALFSDGMVLQRETAAPVWGRAAPGEEIEVRGSWGEEVARTAADAEGRWRVDLPTPGAGGPWTLLVRAGGGEELLVEDVWTGEVWIASGQSNMEWPLKETSRGQLEIAAADHPRLRFFKVKSAPHMEPAEDFRGTWRVSRPWKVGGVTAVGFHFGLELLRELDVPVGIVDTTWGGTPAMAWTSATTLAARGDFADELARIREALEHPESYVSLEAQRASWWEHLAGAERGMREGWMERSHPDDDWDEVTLPGTWAEAGLGDHDGCVWYRRRVEVPEEWGRLALALELGPIDDMDLTWVDGQLVGESVQEGLWNAPRRYAVPRGLARSGSVITVCAVDSGGVGRVGREGLPMRLAPVRGVADGKGVEAIDLAGSWRMRVGGSLEDLGSWPRGHWFNQQYPTSLFNGFVSPLIPFAVRGAIWYQGEADVARYELYRTLFPDMIRDWRAHWGRGDFPFYFVQIAPFAYAEDTGQAALLREAQTAALALPATGMAVTMDIGEPDDIHPRNKHDVGHRLALLALARTYGRDGLDCEGPAYRSMAVEGNRVRLEFEHADGLEARGGTALCFTVAGADRVFHPARAVIEGRSVVVSSEAVDEPVAVRFGWGAADVTNLVNGAGLPAASFRTDRWD